MAIKLIIDSASDISCDKANEMGLIHLPIIISFDGKEYKDGQDLTPDLFFEKLIESDSMPTTSQISPTIYEEAFTKVLENGDTPVAITLSSKLSGTYQSACIANEAVDGKAYIIDSLNASLGEAILVQYAVSLVNSGVGVDELIDELNSAKEKIHVLALLETLEYLKRGGRISKTVALAGSLLSIKPVISIEQGEVALAGKARGSKNANNLLAELISKCGEVDFSKPFTLAFSGSDGSVLNKYVEDSRQFWEHGTSSLPILKIGATIGTHIGPGAIGVAFFSK